MRYALGIEYNGSAFNGWQIQREDPSVQACLQKALAVVADHEVTVFCAGRTDTGVHAAGQVVHFDSDVVRTQRQWVLGINSHLPDSVSVRWARKVSDDFHARFSAVERQYQYTILNRWVRPALASGLVTWVRRPLDEKAMNEAVTALLGEHDFSAFRSAGCKARHAVREINHASVERHQDTVIFNVAANGFLYHMVRNIIGSLIEIGKGKKPTQWIGELLHAGDRTQAGITAAPDGLCFMAARYPESFQIPEKPEAFPEQGNGL
jgi:tRNA pseudouridine38-40 synthase